MPHVAVTAVGVDRPGIVAAVTGVLLRHGGNLEDTAMTRLGGHFAMVLVVEVPGDEDALALEAALAAEVAPIGLTVTVRPIEEVAGSVEEGAPWAVTVHGADRPGIVHRVTTALAEHGANIVDLATHHLTSEAGTGYVVLLSILLPVSADTDALAGALDALAADLGVDVHLRPDEADFL
jgi:glycine cleavage system transcriptional repressor